MEGKIITCCGDCVYYDWKKHRCKNGHNDNSNPRKHFYSDCKTLLDLEEHDKQIRAEVYIQALDDLVKLACEYYTMQEKAGYCADTNNMIKQRIADFAEQLKEQK